MHRLEDNIYIGFRGLAMGSGEICGGSGGGKPRRWHLSGGQHTQQTCRSIGREERSELDGVAPLPQKHRVKDDPLNRPYCGYDGQPIQWAVPGVVKLGILNSPWLSQGPLASGFISEFCVFFSW